MLFAQTPVFRSTTNLQSLAVQVVDGKGNFIPGLTAPDFTLLEDGRPQKIAFFGADQQPVSLALLLDSSRSMDFGRKFDRAREFAAPLIAGHQPTDQIFFAPFTDRIAGFRQLTEEERRHPERIQTDRVGTDRGTALYDALASALCRMRTAENLRQAVVAITDGADQHSRLNLEQLIELARLSSAQVFMIGFFSRAESREYRESGNTVTLVGERDIDNPMVVFNRLSKESGAESFFPSSDADLKIALDRISEMLNAQYTLAYYPDNADRFRKIDVRIRRGGFKVIARRGVGSAAGANGPVRFEASSCFVSAEDHPYPWEPKSIRTVSGALIYHEDFADPKSGWPNSREQIPARSQTSIRDRVPAMATSEYRPGLHYVPGGYQISRHAPAELAMTGPIADGTVVAYGPSWKDMRASISVQTDWAKTAPPHGSLFSYSEMAPGLVFHLGETGYYSLLLTRGAFALVRRMFSDDGTGLQAELIPWTPLLPNAGAGRTNVVHNVSVEYKAGNIVVTVDGQRVATAHDDRVPNGMTGMAVFGRGDAVFRDLLVEDLR
jgi:Ca-activated chloride channel homolog